MEAGTKSQWQSKWDSLWLAEKCSPYLSTQKLVTHLCDLGQRQELETLATVAQVMHDPGEHRDGDGESRDLDNSDGENVATAAYSPLQNPSLSYLSLSLRPFINLCIHISDEAPDLSRGRRRPPNSAVFQSKLSRHHRRPTQLSSKRSDYGNPGDRHRQRDLRSRIREISLFSL
ncbi:hypothetical protein TIFTF001_038893 [Ficus carica]|uniref:Uncharacterized protein n=1 Tax=Ficus carica TaxID=3494 RepID=A0AA88JEG4_FICCA|nr:hypothetical protein TIFTF001_038893 [Ficus carica]